MKKTLSLLMALILTASLCIGFASCAGNQGPHDQITKDPNGSNSKPTRPFKVDLAGYVANIGNATALGISDTVGANASPAAVYGKDGTGVQLLSVGAPISDKDTESKKYIVMSTTDYDANAPEADQTGLTKVTFTKIVTENVTTETIGTKYILASNGAISISAVEGFHYSVYLDDTLIYNEVQDNDTTDKNSEAGIILLDNLTDGVEYKVEYRGQGVETTITQDEIDGEIDKLCVMNGYTFISFVPIGTSERPTDTQDLKKDANGYIAYDLENYFSNSARQSFVIDNATGYVYPIKDVTIQKLHNNLLSINGLVYDYNVVDDNLNFFPLFTNQTITVVDYMKDTYGNNYVLTDKLETYDEATGTTYFIKSANVEYFLSPKNTVLYLSHGTYEREDFSLKEINSNREFVSLDKDTEMNVNFGFEWSWAMNDWKFTRVSGGYAYFHGISRAGMGDTSYLRYDLVTEEYEYAELGIYGDSWVLNALNSVWIDDNHVVFYTDLVDGKGRLYTAQIWGENGAGTNVSADNGEHKKPVYNNSAWLQAYLNRTDELKPVLLLENCVQEIWNNHTYSDWKLSVSSLTSTEYYKIAMIDGEVRIVNASNYVAPAPQNYTLYPLNK